MSLTTPPSRFPPDSMNALISRRKFSHGKCVPTDESHRHHRHHKKSIRLKWQRNFFFNESPSNNCRAMRTIVCSRIAWPITRVIPRRAGYPCRRRQNPFPKVRGRRRRRSPRRFGKGFCPRRRRVKSRTFGKQVRRRRCPGDSASYSRILFGSRKIQQPKILPTQNFPNQTFSQHNIFPTRLSPAPQLPANFTSRCGGIPRFSNKIFPKHSFPFFGSVPSRSTIPNLRDRSRRRRPRRFGKPFSRRRRPQKSRTFWKGFCRRRQHHHARTGITHKSNRFALTQTANRQALQNIARDLLLPILQPCELLSGSWLRGVLN